MNNFFPPITQPCYATPQQIRRILGTQGQSTNDDDILLWFCNEASRKIDDFCTRFFYVFYQTINVDWPGNSFVLHMPMDLHTIVQITNGDGNILPATTQFGGQNPISTWYLYPNSEYPQYKWAMQ